MLMMKATAYLYPNRPFEGGVLTDIWGRTYRMRYVFSVGGLRLGTSL